ncbi:MAG: hypothetical protein JXQ65_06985 [Candidatus Marinimicrobia bacterium]|nr:hypothetical protein [Candidatus Neomarinimicrobiota bacterium]
MDLAVTFSDDAKLEVGGPFVGAEFHHSYMVPQRISFFYPIANSIDQSRDFWKRDTSFVSRWHLKIGNDDPRELKESSVFDLMPHTVSFQKEYEKFSIVTDYGFCKNKPAMVVKILITNQSGNTEKFQFSSRYINSIRTCHSFKTLNTGKSEVFNNSVITVFDEKDADFAAVFIANAGDLPEEIQLHKTSSNLIYEKMLKTNESLEIIQVIGSSKQDESKEIISYLLTNYQAEVDEFDQFVKAQALERSIMQTHSSQTDHSVAYAKAVMAANAHYLDGEIVPMPCPAEYNFYFTHDVQVTDLAAVNFDLPRVKQDLDYILRHADENHIIPHAYYWRDGKYITEYADSDNWNNFWLVQLAAKYYRHSNDIEFMEKLYPCVTKSLESSLLTLEDDNLMWSNRPDWWDIGHNYGPRTYMTVLAIKSMRDYVYISTVLDKNPQLVKKYKNMADAMQTALVEKLWNENMQYLVNYHNDGSLDEHYYIGSLLAVCYGLLDVDKSQKLIQTATEKMVDPEVGIYNAFPMDFEKWGDFMGFVGNEAGAKYYYFNGGIWPQGNAWYALALMANGDRQKAAEFIENTMSLNGILKGPNGQPAYYEVRNANRDNPTEYGSVDKPQFLWAAAWYLNALYNLHFIIENTWNLMLSPYLLENQKECRASLSIANKNVDYLISGENSLSTVSSILFDGKPQYSLVIPIENHPDKSIVVRTGKVKYPYLESCNAILQKIEWTENQITMDFSAYQSHENEVVITAPKMPESVMLDNQIITNWTIDNNGDFVKIKINFTHDNKIAYLAVKF